jgi:hypothetical protein
MIFWLYVVTHLVPLWRKYRIYRRTVVLNAGILYARRKNNREIDWAREYLTRSYLECHLLSFSQWLKSVRSYGSK